MPKPQSYSLCSNILVKTNKIRAATNISAIGVAQLIV
jgi:hypothetical protein